MANAEIGQGGRDPVISVSGLTKRFGATVALADMRLEGREGEIHALMGENGAGKSTLIKVLAGVHRPDAGTIRLEGRVIAPADPRAARAAGISTIFQEFSLLPNLSIEENFFLGATPVPRGERRARARAALQRLGLDLDPGRAVAGLSVGQQQMLEIGKGLLAEARVFVFDEPTAALAAHEVDVLFDLIRGLAAEGKAVLYVSHRLNEVFALCDTITVMKDGAYVTTLARGETTQDAIIEAMVGRPLADFFPPRGRPGGPLLVSSGLGGRHLADLTLHEGEILGVAGLEGQGQQELMRRLAGFAEAKGGSLTLGGARIEHLGARGRMARGLGFVPEDRKADGLFPSQDVHANLEIAATARRPFLGRARRLSKPVAGTIKRLGVKAASARQGVSDLSGGNQQKVVLGRWLIAGARVLLCEEPTRGVDIGAKRDIYDALRDFAAGGGGVLVTSRELTELIGLCDRIVVIRDGALVHDCPGEGATEDDLLRRALPGAAAA